MAKSILTKTCLIPSCPKKHKARGYCSSHYSRFWRYGDPSSKYKIPRIKYCIVGNCKKHTVNQIGYCNMHYQRWKRHGNPLICLNRRDLTPEQRFWNFVDKTNACWIWNGPKTQSGYGVITIDQKTIRAHRYSYFLAKKVWPNPCCLHSCDNPPCVNPNHLRAGTALENSKDMIRRGRQKGGCVQKT